MRPDITLLEGLRVQSEKAIHDVYLGYYSSVEKYIVMNSGTAQDAEDVFQDTVMVLLSYVSKPDFKLTCSMKTLLFAIARRIWLKQLRHKTRQEALTELEIQQQDFIADWEEVERSQKKYDSLPAVLNRISVHCSGLLKQLFLTGKIPDHYKNDHSMRNQKYKCLEQARKMMKKLDAVSG